MQIMSMRYGKTKNLGNYQSEKLEVEVIASPGQTPEAALDELREYIDGTLGFESDKPPMRKSKAGGTAEGEGGGTTSKDAAPSPPKTEAPKKKRGRPKKKPDHEKELQYALEAKSVEELADRLDDLRTMRDCFDWPEWRDAMKDTKQLYNKLNTADPASEELVKRVADYYTAERTYVAECIQQTNGGAAAA